MNHSKLPNDFVQKLLMQDNELAGQNMDERRRDLLQRLAETEANEKQSRRRTLLAMAACFIILFAIASFAFVTQTFYHPETLPNWIPPILALLFILAPTATLMLCAVYLVRYRRPLAKLRIEAQQEALRAIPRQIDELRETIRQLQSQLKTAATDKTASQKPGGFTVIELLVSVVILTILASLLFPALSAAKGRARSTVCRSNLSQIGKALVMYESDNHYLPGAGDAGIIQSKQTNWALPSTNSWILRLKPYGAPKEEIFECPEHRPQPIVRPIKSDAFGYNAGGSAEIYKHMDLNLGLGFGKSNFVASTFVKAPADMVAIGDMQSESSVWLNIISPQSVPIGRLTPVPKRHGGGANMLFLDGHIEWQKQFVWTAKNHTRRARWNNDHEPHPETW
jgi:prepilin-type processing-associated H-X9-DG protein/prepilin-type N-terminal cleavage/methylation domain-containing protein